MTKKIVENRSLFSNLFKIFRLYLSKGVYHSVLYSPEEREEGLILYVDLLEPSDCLTTLNSCSGKLVFSQSLSLSQQLLEETIRESNLVESGSILVSLKYYLAKTEEYFLATFKEKEIEEKSRLITFWKTLKIYPEKIIVENIFTEDS
jgi:hypothetical protein